MVPVEANEGADWTGHEAVHAQLPFWVVGSYFLVQGWRI